MAVSKELLDILVCPKCKTPVRMVAWKGPWVDDQQTSKSETVPAAANVREGLKCDTCHRVYPVRDDIPVMLVDEARIEAS